MRFLPQHFARQQRKKDRPRSRHRRFARRRALVEALEDRQLLATITVDTSLDVIDSGDGLTSLREAVIATNSMAGPDTIEFDSSLDGTPIELSIAGRMENFASTGDLDVQSEVSIVGNGASATIIDGGGIDRVFEVFSSGILSIEGATIQGGLATDNTVSNATASGGAIYLSPGATVTLTDSRVSANSAAGDPGRPALGGGIVSYGTLNVIGTTIENNTAIGGDGAPASAGGNANGGGIASGGGQLTITSSTLSDNLALGGPAGLGANDGVAEGGGIDSPANATIINSTISGNSAADRGGGVNLRGQGRLVNSTVTGNTGASGGGVYAYGAIGLTIHNSVIAANISGGTTPDLSAAVSAVVLSSLIGEGQGSQLPESQTADPTTGNLVGALAGAGRIDPSLGPLALNGGSTRTHALQTDSPAIDAGNTALALDASGAALTTDQRDAPFVRNFGITDIGAYELQTIDPSFFVVTTTNDELDYSNSDVSLREAVANAAGSSGADTVTFGGALFADGIADTITLGGSQIEISDDVTIAGADAGLLTISGDNRSRIFHTSGAAKQVILTNLTLTAGMASDGGAILNSGNLTITDSTLSGNQGSNGGAIYSSGPLTLTRSTISGNSNAGGGGGGVYSVDALNITDSTISGNSTDADGGGILSTGSLTMLNSTVSGNVSDVDGGGLWSSGDFSIVNSTISGNDAPQHGGGLHLSGGQGRLVNSTITLNDALYGGGMYAYHAGSLTIHNTIIAGNSSSGSTTDLFAAGSASILNSLIGEAQGSQLLESQAADPVTGNFVGASAGIGRIDPLLGLLGANGGPTQTHELMFGSRAINHGEVLLALGPGPDGISGNSDDLPLQNDQRGAPVDRTVGVSTDIGAYERVILPASAFVVTTGDDESDFVNTEVSLREAVVNANVSAGDETITFDPAVTNSYLYFGELEVGGAAVTIQGNGANQTTISASYAISPSRIFNLTGTGAVTFDGVTLTGGNTSGNGGAINASSSSVAPLTIRQSTISGNSSSNSDTSNSGGGGIFAGSRPLIVVDSTISGNSATGDGGGINSPFSGDVTLVNSTVSGNAADASGGGLYFVGGAAHIINSTITTNSAAGAGGGIGNLADDAGETLTIHNSIVARNNDDGTAPDFVAPGSPATNLEVIASLIGNNTGTTLPESPTQDLVTLNIVGDPSGGGLINPLLDVLGNNGGPTQTHSLLTGSPALDHGANSLANGTGPDGILGTSDDVALAGDQRGAPFNRIDGNTVDMGAYEQQVYNASSLVVNSAVDVLDFDDTQISLREAIIGATEKPGDDTITFDSSLFSTPQTIALALGQLSALDQDALTIDGPGSDLLTVDAQGLSRVLFFDGPGDRTIGGITITGGQTTQDNQAGDGAGVRSIGSGSLTVTDSDISGNTIQGDNAYGAGLSTYGDLTISGSTITGNETNFRGGGLYAHGTAFITNTTISGNTAGSIGGGLFVESETTISDSTISGNSAADRGGGLYIAVGDLTVLDSTISGNSATNDGGGIVSPNNGNISLINSTISGNTAGGRGGGLFFYSGETRVINSTVTANTAGINGGGISNYANDYGESLAIHNSIIAGNASAVAPDFVAPFDAVDLEVLNSLIGDNSGTTLAESQTADPITGNFVGDPNGIGTIDPLLDALADNSGATETHALLAGTLAVDAGDTSLAVGLGFDGISGTPDDIPLANDQRGAPFGRENGASVDIGAFELDTTPPVLTAPQDTTLEGDTTGGTLQASAATFLDGATATDDVNPAPTITHDAPSVFPLGPTLVTFTADDGSGNTATATATVTILDSTAPTLDAPNDISVEGDSLGGTTASNGAIATFLTAATSTDIVDSDPTITHDAPTLFFVGPTLITFTSQDDSGNSVTDFAVVTVTDTTSPMLVVPDDITVEANVVEGAEATLAVVANFLAGASASDVVDPNPAITTDAPTIFPVGVTTVIFTATDNTGNETMATASVTVTEMANTPPTITDISDLSVAVNSATGAITFTIGDTETALDSLDVAATSSDQTLVPNANITVAGTGADRTITITPAADQTGTATITVTVTDEGSLTATDTFVLTVTATVADPVVHISPNGPGGAPDPDDLPSGAQPTSWALQRSDLREIVIDLGASISSVTANDLVLTNLGINAPVDADAVVPVNDSQLSLSPDGLKLTISFAANELTDGVYQLDLLAAITGGDTFTITGDSTNKFYVLTGDWNGSGGVNIQDFATFAYWFGGSVPSTAPAYVDVNDTGGINIQDFSGFAANFSNEIIFPGGVGALNAGAEGEGELESALRTLLNPTDVNGDGAITARDALNVMNEIARGGSFGNVAWSKFDANQDGEVTMRDALFVINRLADDPEVSQIGSILRNLSLDKESTSVDDAGPGLLRTLLRKVTAARTTDVPAIDTSILDAIDSVVARFVSDDAVSIDNVIDLLSLDRPD